MKTRKLSTEPKQESNDKSENIIKIITKKAVKLKPEALTEGSSYRETHNIGRRKSNSSVVTYSLNSHLFFDVYAKFDQQEVLRRLNGVSKSPKKATRVPAAVAVGEEEIVGAVMGSPLGSGDVSTEAAHSGCLSPSNSNSRSSPRRLKVMVEAAPVGEDEAEIPSPPLEEHSPFRSPRPSRRSPPHRAPPPPLNNTNNNHSSREESCPTATVTNSSSTISETFQRLLDNKTVFKNHLSSITLAAAAANTTSSTCNGKAVRKRRGGRRRRPSNRLCKVATKLQLQQQQKEEQQEVSSKATATQKTKKKKGELSKKTAKEASSSVLFREKRMASLNAAAIINCVQSLFGSNDNNNNNNNSNSKCVEEEELEEEEEEDDDIRLELVKDVDNVGSSGTEEHSVKRKNCNNNNNENENENENENDKESNKDDNNRNKKKVKKRKRKVVELVEEVNVEDQVVKKRSSMKREKKEEEVRKSGEESVVESPVVCDHDSGDKTVQGAVNSNIKSSGGRRSCFFDMMSMGCTQREVDRRVAVKRRNDDTTTNNKGELEATIRGDNKSEILVNIGGQRSINRKKIKRGKIKRNIEEVFEKEEEDGRNTLNNNSKTKKKTKKCKDNNNIVEKIVTVVTAEGGVSSLNGLKEDVADNKKNNNNINNKYGNVSKEKKDDNDDGDDDNKPLGILKRVRRNSKKLKSDHVVSRKTMKKRKGDGVVEGVLKKEEKDNVESLWLWEGDACEQSIKLQLAGELVLRTCYGAIRHKNDDVIIKVDDCVMLRSVEEGQEPYLAKITSFFFDQETGKKMMTLLWYYRPEHTDQGRLMWHSVADVYASKHLDTNSVDCIDDKAFVLTEELYSRFMSFQRRQSSTSRQGLTSRMVPTITEDDKQTTVPAAGDVEQQSRTAMTISGEPSMQMFISNLYYTSNFQMPSPFVPEMTLSNVFVCRGLYDIHQRRIIRNILQLIQPPVRDLFELPCPSIDSAMSISSCNSQSPRLGDLPPSSPPRLSPQAALLASASKDSLSPSVAPLGNITHKSPKLSTVTITTTTTTVKQQHNGH